MPEARKFIRFIIFILCLASSFSHLASATDDDSDNHKLPRFVSIRAKEINLRTGPGERYPIDWVIKDGKGWPLEVTEEFDNWRRVKDFQGTTGWVHLAMLSKKQAIVTTKDNIVLRRSPSNDSSARARVQVGTHGALKKCEKNWCEVEFDGGKGWLPASAIWGTDANLPVTAQSPPKD